MFLGRVRSLLLQQGQKTPSHCMYKPQSTHLFCPLAYLNATPTHLALYRSHMPLQVNFLTPNFFLTRLLWPKLKR